ncbi:hypothetical protein TWF281_011000 [Arthrobotrys megalospora]
MYIPPEIILNILDYLDCTSDYPTNDRATLISLRSASKDFSAIVTPVLFRDFSLHYGVSRSVPQMRAVASSSTLRLHIRSLFVPSESFFPLGKDVQFNIKDNYPWSRGPVLDWLTTNNYSQATPVRKGIKGRRNHAEQTLMLHHPFREYPTRPWQQFSLSQKEFREQHQEYSKALSEFLDSCGNLEEVHIAMGLGVDTARMPVFGRILGKYMIPRIISKGIRRLKVSAPSSGSVTLPFRGYAESSNNLFGKLVEFSSLESFVIHSCYGNIAWPASADFAVLFSTLTNLTSFNLLMSSPLKCESTREIFGNPKSATSQHLTKVTLGSIFLRQYDNQFEAFLSEVPTVTELILHYIVLQTAFRLPENNSLPQENWRYLFRHIITALPKLTTYKFGLLMYGAEHTWWGQFPKDAQLLLPTGVDSTELNSRTWSNILRGFELVSPYEEDWKGLESLRTVVRDRRLVRGLETNRYGDINVPAWVRDGGEWTFITDK